MTIFLFIVLGIGLTGWGLRMALAGLYPRRRGSMPHCGRCDYNLTGNQSNICPECGTPLTDASIVLGERHRRRGLAAAGISTALFGLALVLAVTSPAFRSIQWIHHRPAGWLIDDLTSGDTQREDRAWAELQRRALLGELAESIEHRWVAAAFGQLNSPNLTAWERSWSFLEKRDAIRIMTDAQRHQWAATALAIVKSGTATRALPAWKTLQGWDARNLLPPGMAAGIIELALVRQVAPDNQPCDDALMEFLGNAVKAGRLSEQQAERFFSQAVIPRLRVRPTAIAGDELPYTLAHSGRGPRDGWWHKLTLVSAKLGSTQAGHGGSSSGSGLGAGGLGSWIRTEGLAPGKHPFELTINVEAFEGKHPGLDKNQGKPRWSRQLTLSAETELLPIAPANYVRHAENALLQSAVEDAVSIPRYARWPEDAMVQVEKAPANLAFAVIARADGKEHLLGSLAIRQGESCTFSMSHSAARSIKAARIDLVLRSSETVARRTVDLFEIWKGEVVIADVPTVRK